MNRERLIINLSKIPESVRLLFVIIIIIMAVGALMPLIEPTTFNTWFDGIWWAFVTSATVGYGDFVPKSFLAKLITIFLILTGAAFMTLYLTTIAKTTTQWQQKRFSGQAKYLGVQHMIIVGWNETTKQLLQHFNHKKDAVAIIDETLQSAPDASMHFIKGCAYEDHTLQQAGIESAQKLLITADPELSEHQADMRTLMTALTVKRLRPDLFIAAEILTGVHENAVAAGVDHIIESSRLVGDALWEAAESNR